MILMLQSRGVQSILDPQGTHATAIARLWDVFLVVSVIVYVLVIAATILALVRRGTASTKSESRTATIVVSSASALTLLTLFGLLVASISTGRTLAERPKGALPITVIGRQWWWEVQYDDANKSSRITTANEIVVPVGTPVTVHLLSMDVIHSFWVPNLHGKQDLIPGHRNAIVIQADRPGVYRGQCAEFCGLQHAKMALWVNAVSREDYERWTAAQRLASKAPSTESQRKGQEVFMSSPCPLCHTIRGTDASGRTGPDLTHFASRRSIAAATLPNRRGHLAGWILDPQHVKPGNKMPAMVLQQGELDPLLDYLESLR
jgi:cytochrome c oxidase subunit 2